MPSLIGCANGSRNSQNGSRNSQSPVAILLRDFQVHPPATFLMNDPVHRPFGTDIVPYFKCSFPLASLTFFPFPPALGIRSRAYLV